ncbi:MAG TPA: hypothetical protein ENI23_15705 [bacterium]|nr:hypothetical protein [bacterium]
MTLDNYTQSYGANETTEVIIDLLLIILITFIGFGTLISLILIATWFQTNTGVNLGMRRGRR